MVSPLGTLDNDDSYKKCKECGGTGCVNTFDGSDTGGATAEYWPGPCPSCVGSTEPKKMPLECINCGSATGPLWPIDSDCPGWLCIKCYKSTAEATK